MPGLGRPPGGRYDNPIQFSCLENPIDRGAWWGTVHGVAQNWTWLKWLSTHSPITSARLPLSKAMWTIGLCPWPLAIRARAYNITAAAAAAKSLQSCLTLCDPTRRQPTGLPVPGILQARTLECVAIYFANAWKWKVKVKSLSLVRLLAIPQDGSLQGSSVHGIFQARVLEWGAIPFSLYCH